MNRAYEMGKIIDDVRSLKLKPDAIASIMNELTAMEGATKDAVLSIAPHLGADSPDDAKETRAIVDRVKSLELEPYQIGAIVLELSFVHRRAHEAVLGIKPDSGTDTDHDEYDHPYGEARFSRDDNGNLVPGLPGDSRSAMDPNNPHKRRN